MGPVNAVTPRKDRNEKDNIASPEHQALRRAQPMMVLRMLGV